MNRSLSRRLAFSLLIAVLPLVASAQTNPIPNAGFETWANGMPVEWFANNIPTMPTVVMQDASAHSGSFALQGTIGEFMSTPIPPVIQRGFPIATRYAALTGWYKNAPVGGDSLIVEVVIHNGGNPIGLGAFFSGATVGTYTQFSAPIDYFSPDPADSAYIIITTVAEDAIHVGTTFSIDDLLFTGVSAVEAEESVQPGSYVLLSNYPNPFNPSTTIAYSLSTESQVRISIYDLTGRVVSTLLDDVRPSGVQTITWKGNAPSGMYVCRMVATLSDGRTFISSRKIALLR